MMRTLRSRASNDFPCAPERITIAELGGTSFRATGCGSTVVYDCPSSFLCVPERPFQSSEARAGDDTKTRAGSPEASAKEVASAGVTSEGSDGNGAATPAGAGGFTFGDTVEESRADCEPDHSWKASGPALFECSGAPKTIGLDARVLLKFCKGALCKLVFLARPDSDQSGDWLRPFVGLKTGLAGKYGPPLQDNTVPSRCTRDLLPCIRSGDAHIKYWWAFPGGSFVVLVLSSAPGPDAAIRLTYSRAEAIDAKPEPAAPPAL
jgi:hypothetical protein